MPLLRARGGRGPADSGSLTSAAAAGPGPGAPRAAPAGDNSPGPPAPPGGGSAPRAGRRLRDGSDTETPQLPWAHPKPPQPPASPGDSSQPERPQTPHPKPTFAPGAVPSILRLQQLPVLFPGERRRRGTGRGRRGRGCRGSAGGCPRGRDSPEGPPQAVQVLEEALSLHRGLQGVTPVLQGDAVPGPVTSQPWGTAVSPHGGHCPAPPGLRGHLPAPVLSRWWQQLHLSPRKTPGWYERSTRGLFPHALRRADSHWFSSLTHCGVGDSQGDPGP